MPWCRLYPSLHDGYTGLPRLRLRGCTILIAGELPGCDRGELSPVNQKSHPTCALADWLGECDLVPIRQDCELRDTAIVPASSPAEAERVA